MKELNITLTEEQKAEEPKIYFDEQFADSLTKEQQAFLARHMDYLFTRAYMELLRYKASHTKANMIDFMEYASIALEIDCLLNREIHEYYPEVRNAYDKILEDARNEALEEIRAGR